MSKISVNETYGGNTLRKAIDYSANVCLSGFLYNRSEKRSGFCKTEYFQKMALALKNENDDIYDPLYTDMLRVAFTTEFKRGKIADLVALVSGRNFETKKFEESIVEDLSPV